MSLGHAPAAQALDGLLLAQQAVAAVAAKHSLVASFLPKPLAGAAGSGMHMHFSLWQGESNLLAHDPPRPKVSTWACSGPGLAWQGMDLPCAG